MGCISWQFLFESFYRVWRGVIHGYCRKLPHSFSLINSHIKQKKKIWSSNHNLYSLKQSRMNSDIGMPKMIVRDWIKLGSSTFYYGIMIHSHGWVLFIHPRRTILNKDSIIIVNLYGFFRLFLIFFKRAVLGHDTSILLPIPWSCIGTLNTVCRNVWSDSCSEENASSINQDYVRLEYPGGNSQ